MTAYLTVCVSACSPFPFSPPALLRPAIDRCKIIRPQRSCVLDSGGGGRFVTTTTHTQAHGSASGLHVWGLVRLVCIVRLLVFTGNRSNAAQAGMGEGILLRVVFLSPHTHNCTDW